MIKYAAGSGIFLISLLLLFACGHKEGVVQPESKSYLSFSGNIANAVVYLDNEQSFEIKRGLIHYRITPGKHRIVVKRNGEIVINRIIVVGNGMTKEIFVP